MDPNAATAAEIVIQCQRVVNKETGKKDLKAAENYLSKVQQSPNSWSMLFDILEMEDLQIEIYGQVAILLRQKFQFDFYQLPQSEYWNTSQLLIRNLMKHDNSAIITNLGRALVLLYMNAFETLGDLIDILESTLMADHGKEWLGLKVIKLMSQVPNMQQVLINQKQIDQYISHLNSTQVSKVFDMLEKQAKNDSLSHQLKSKVLDCFQEWVYFIRENDALMEKIPNHPCFSLALASLKDTLTAKMAGVTINTVLENIATSELEFRIYELISGHIKEYMEQCNTAIKENDLDHVLDLIDILGFFTEKFKKLMMTQSDGNILKLLNCFVMLTRNQNLGLDVFLSLVTSWTEISKDFFDDLNNSPFSTKIDEFTEIFKQLVEILCQRAQKEAEQLQYTDIDYNEPIDDKDLDDEFNDPDKENERASCASVLLSIRDLIGFTKVLKIISANYEVLITKIGDGTLDYQNIDMQTLAQLESFLFAVKSCLVSLKEKPDLTEFTNIVMSIKFDNPKVNRTKNLLIESITKETFVSESSIASIWNYLIEWLPRDEEKVTGIVGVALMNLCEHSDSFVINNFESYLEMREQFDQNSDFFTALGLAVIKNENTELQGTYLSQLYTPLAERVLKNIEIWENERTKEAQEEIRINVRKLDCIFKKVFEDPKAFENKNNPLEPFFNQLWPIIKSLLEKFPEDSNLIEILCNLIKKCMRFLGPKFEPFVVEYLKAACDLLKKNPTAVGCYYAIEVSVSMFGKLPHMEQPLTQAFEAAATTFLDYLMNNGSLFVENEALIEDYFGMLCRSVKYLPRAVLYSKTIDENLMLAENAFEIKHTRIEKTVVMFIEYLFHICRDDPQDEIQKAITDIMIDSYGTIYTQKLIKKLIPFPVEGIRTYARDAIVESFIGMKSHSLQWLESAFEQVPETILSEGEKQEMIESLNKIDVTQAKIKRKINEKQPEEVKKVFQLFSNVFDVFESRCEWVKRRQTKFEKFKLKVDD